MQTLTKFDQFKKFLIRKKTFRFRDVEKVYGFPSTETTYLNTLRRAGLVEQVERGHYKISDIASLKAVSLSNLHLSLKAEKLEVEKESLERQIARDRVLRTRDTQVISEHVAKIERLEDEVKTLLTTTDKRVLELQEQTDILSKKLYDAKANNRTMEERLLKRHTEIEKKARTIRILKRLTLVLAVGLAVAVIL